MQLTLRPVNRNGGIRTNRHPLSQPPP